MQLPNIIHKVYSEPWIIQAETHAAIRQALEDKLAGTANQPVAFMDIDQPERRSPNAIDGGVAVIPVHGIIGKHLSGLEMMCGGFSLDSLSASLDSAMETSAVHTIVLDIRSPGGTVTGVQEAAAEIRAAAEEKPIVAFIDTIGASAGYWIASQATSISVAPSAQVGGIGVYSYSLDHSARLEKEGIKVNEFKSGTLKTAGAPWRAMTPEESALAQESVDKVGVLFREAITSVRDVAAEVMQGQVFTGAEAIANNLADELHASLKALVADLRMGEVVAG